MPSVSKAQKRFFGYLEGNPQERERRGLSKETVDEFASGSSARLPERVGERHPAIISRRRSRHHLK